VVLHGQLAKLLIRLQQEIAQLVRVDRHTPRLLAARPDRRADVRRPSSTRSAPNRAREG
jgi:hypothetical protein